MNAQNIVATLVLFCVSLGSLAAPSIDITSFSAASGVQLVGSATFANAKLRLTSSQVSQRSAAWINTPQDVTQSFTATVNFTIAGPVVSGHPTWPNGADGFALVIQDDPRTPLNTVIGGSSDELGYGANAAEPWTAIRRSLALTVRTTVFQKIQVYANDDSPYLRFTQSGGSPIASPVAEQTGSLGTILGTPQKLTFSYDAGNQALTVLLNNASIGIDAAPLGASLSSIVGANTATFGFTAATGGGYATTDITAFSAAAAVPEPSATLLALTLLSARCVRRRMRGR
ncbi:MAG: hypothetical protein JWN40_1643 [Phycisphaerales bacterium]|nr:hypothetical protein [Phycisphaerales bacterium]